MAMLTDKEVAGISSILRSLKKEDLRLVASTVTNYMVSPETVEEAVQVICVYATNASSVLKRKKIKKELIFKYLHNEGQHICPTLEKREIVKAALAYWDSTDQNETLELEEDTPPVGLQEVRDLTPVAQEVSQQVTGITTGNPSSSDSEIIEEMGKKFTVWFYTIWRSTHPLFVQNESNDEFGPQHFWPDCRCHLEIKSSVNVVSTHDFSSNEDVASCFKHLLVQDNIFLNPNVGPGGIKVHMDCHGLVKIFVCGTVHNLNTCIGLFEQLFGLAEECGSNGKWKIKFTNINLQYNNNGLPSSEVSQKALAPCSETWAVTLNTA